MEATITQNEATRLIELAVRSRGTHPKDASVIERALDWDSFRECFRKDYIATPVDWDLAMCAARRIATKPHEAIGFSGRVTLPF